ncbi:hypothetical protein WN51_00402 [Melipona quadrifasciata]|uniref:Uncharacterized protein n=1 Tax=Melipona quadrifasciata TaxID=166423 RepID=A0A0M9A2D9_9HYME|nr:hypothetical protein WN51_00402 [Melipona quadrifasciata]
MRIARTQKWNSKVQRSGEPFHQRDQQLGSYTFRHWKLDNPQSNERVIYRSGLGVPRLRIRLGDPLEVEAIGPEKANTPQRRSRRHTKEFNTQSIVLSAITSRNIGANIKEVTLPTRNSNYEELKTQCSSPY